MTDDTKVLSLLSAYLDTLSHSPSERVLRDALTTIDSTPQRRRWALVGGSRTRQRGLSAPGLLAFVAVAALAVLLVVAQLWNRLPNNPIGETPPIVVTPAPSHSRSPQPNSPEPTANPSATSSPGSPGSVEITGFSVPFTFQVPPDSNITLARENSAYVELVSHTAHDRPAGSYSWAGGILYPAPFNGIIVAATAGAVMDSCPRSISTREIKPYNDVLQVLHDYAGFNLTATPTTVAGEAGSLITDVTADCLDHLHFGGGQGPATMALTAPYQKLYLIPFDDTSVIIQIWAASAGELDSWLPIAQQVVDSIRFSHQGAGTAAPAQQPVSGFGVESAFEKPFTYAVPDGTTLFRSLGRSSIEAFYGPPYAAGPTPSDAPAGYQYAWASHGLIVASTDGAVVRACPPRTDEYEIQTGDDVVSVLQSQGGLVIDTSPLRIMGRDVLLASSIAAGCPDNIRIVYPLGTDPSSDAGLMSLGIAHEMVYFVPVGDTTVLIQAWATTAADAQYWFPVADQIVRSMAFTDRLTPGTR